MAPFGRSHSSSYSSVIVTMAVYCIISEIKRVICKKNDNFSYPSHLTRTINLESLEFLSKIEHKLSESLS